ncbi:MAG: choice-of-anchor L domain-containing protein [Chloroflexi bacterium]|nr:choice-of-anchor L domain-containing protein [Chloroflexota bacterium]
MNDNMSISFKRAVFIITILAVITALVIPSPVAYSQSPSNSTPLRLIESDDPLVIHQGSWSSQAASGASGGSYLFSSGNSDDTLTLEFSGRLVEIVYVEATALGILAIEVDHNVLRTVLTTASTTAFQRRAVIDYLDDTLHTLRLYASSGVIAIDAIYTAIPETTKTLEHISEVGSASTDVRYTCGNDFQCSNQDGGLNGASINIASVFWVNGICTTAAQHRDSLVSLEAAVFPRRVMGIYSGTAGDPLDTSGCIAPDVGTAMSLIMDYIINYLPNITQQNPAVASLIINILNYFEVVHSYPNLTRLEIVGHSRGALIVSVALRWLATNWANWNFYKSYIDITTMGGAAPWFPEGPYYRHYVHLGGTGTIFDPVPQSTGVESRLFDTGVPNTEKIFRAPSLLDYFTTGCTVTSLVDLINHSFCMYLNTYSRGNNDFAARRVVTDLPYVHNMSTSNANHSSEPSPSSLCAPLGVARSVWYQYTPTTTETMQFSTIGSSFDTVISLWTGNPDNVSNLVEVACDNNSGPNSTSVISRVLALGTTYYVQVASNGILGSGGNLRFAVTGGLVNNVVSSLDFPGSLVVSASLGTSDRLGAYVSGPLPGGFPSRGSNFTVLSSGTAAQATRFNNEGSLSTTLGGLNNSSGNDMVQLTLRLRVPPGTRYLAVDWKFLSEEYAEFVGGSFNDSFLMETPTSNFIISSNTITAPNNYAFDNTGQRVSINTTGVTGMSAGNAFGTTYDGGTQIMTSVAPIIPAGTTEITLIFTVMDIGDSLYDTAVFLDNFRFFSGTTVTPGVSTAPIINAPPSPATAAEYNISAGQTLTLQFAASDVDPGDIVTLEIDGPIGSVFTDTPGNPATGTFTWTPSANQQGVYTVPVVATDSFGLISTPRSFTIVVASTPPNDTIGAAGVITTVPFNNAQGTLGARVSTGDPVPSCDSTIGRTVWYRYTPATSRSLNFNTRWSDYATVMAIYRGSPGSLISVGCSYSATGVTSSLNVSVTAGTTYYIMIGGHGGSAGNLRFEITNVTQATDTLALINPSAGVISYIATLVNYPPLNAYTAYAVAPPIGGQWVLGDWDGNGTRTPGVFANGAFYYSNNTGGGAWTPIWIGPNGIPVAGRFSSSASRDCIGVVQQAQLNGMTVFVLWFTCSLTSGTTPTISSQWLSELLPTSAGFIGDFQFIAGDWNNDGLDSIAVRRGPHIAWTNVPPTTLLSAFTFAQYFGVPSTFDYGQLVGGNWDASSGDSFGLFYSDGSFYRRNDLDWNSGIYKYQYVGQPVSIPVSARTWRASSAGGGAGSTEDGSILPERIGTFVE